MSHKKLDPKDYKRMTKPYYLEQPTAWGIRVQELGQPQSKVYENIEVACEFLHLKAQDVKDAIFKCYNELKKPIVADANGTRYNVYEFHICDNHNFHVYCKRN